MSFRTSLIGRGRGADIRLYPGSVSRRHAEVTIVSDGRYFLTDWGSLLGMWFWRRGQWQQRRQAYESGPECVRFGKRVASMAELLRDTACHRKESEPRPTCRSPKPGDWEVER